MDDNTVFVAAIIAVAAVEVAALAMGHNGTLLTLAVGALTTLAGFALGKKK